jgi:hypothetical protein
LPCPSADFSFTAPAIKQKDDDACSCHGKITDQCTTDYPESVSGTNFKRTTGNYRKEYLQDVHSNKTKDSPYSFVIDPDTELFVSREKIESVKILKSSRRSESIIFLLFLIPGTPKDLLSYLVGLTDIKLSHWIIICAVGRMPAIFLSVLSGNALNKADYTFVILMFAVMIALSICGFLFYRSRNKTDSGSENDKK